MKRGATALTAVVVLAFAILVHAGGVVFPKRWTGKPSRAPGIGGSLISQLRPELVVLFDDTVAAVDLVKNQLPTINGNPGFGLTPQLDEVFVSDGVGDGLDYPNRPTAASRDITIAATILLSAQITRSRVVIGTSSSTNAGLYLTVRKNNEKFMLTKGGVVDINSVITILDSVPYFVAASYRHSDGLVNFVVRRLDNLSYSTATATNTQTPNDGDGTYIVGGYAVIPNSVFLGDVGLGVIGEGFLDMDALIAWSSDPYAIFQPQSPQHRHWFSPAAPPGRRLMIISHLSDGQFQSGGLPE